MATRKSKRRTVLGFLLLSVLAPIVLYTDRITKFSNSIRKCSIRLEEAEKYDLEWCSLSFSVLNGGFYF